jgi:hypothetical protein
MKQCDTFILGNKSRQPFHDSTSRACRKPKLIHSYLCGPMLVPSTNGNKHTMSFIDDYTRMCCVYLLTYKSQDFEEIKKIHVWYQTSKHVQQFHTILNKML